ncbi:hypothetical protein P0092_18460 [Ruminiclostridium papyrosolvens DSM 2782]|uniref:hypothetical protein n=1 Tax=Ruminiclostridium papyrosolvens TaxID=29362 RepID=UPI0001B27F08|nr:hypothetical protein [Ruminiclostridium papyrosolvens]WES33727.1 hypothetical protein P0092_18460 [Ruminiclostridium papyrosolvens DSM 2782]
MRKQKQWIIDELLSQKSFKNRLNKDVENGIRIKDIIQRSIGRIKKYDCLNTEKIDVSKISPKQAAEAVSARIL